MFLASIIESIHAATLLHDDVVDQAAFRRRNPSANKLWGNQLPVLVGDYLYAKSFYWLVKDGDYSIMSTVSSATANVTDGEMGKYKTVLQIFAVTGLLLHYTYFRIDFHWGGLYFLWACLLLSIWSGVNYLKKFWSLVIGKPET